MRPVHVLFVCALVTTAAGPAVAGPLAQGSQAEPTEIASCTTITEPGTYVLAEDLRSDDRPSCIRIEADDVVFDGGGHVLDGGTPEVEIGGFVDRTFQDEEPSPTDERWRRAGVVAAEVSNVTVRNLEATGWLVGISLVDVRDGEVGDVTARENGFGVVLAGGENGSVEEATTPSNAGAGIFLLDSRDGSVGESEASDNDLVGVYLFRTVNATVERTTANHNDVAGVLFERATRGAVRGGVAEANGIAGIYLLESDDATVADVAALDNRQIGVYLRDANEVTVHGVDANANTVGIVLENARDATVTDSDATLNDASGIVAFAAHRSRVVDSTANDNAFAGVYVVESEEFAIRDVRATQDIMGVVFENATDGTVSGGAFEGNARTGVTLFNTTGTQVTGVAASRNDYHGVFVVNASDNAVTDSNASYNGLTGVYLRNATRNEIAGNTLLANALSGVFEEDATDNRIADNRDGTVPFDPTDEQLGREGGIAHDDDIVIDQSDGLNDTELQEYIYRAIARAEYIRGLEYNQTVDVEVIARSENRRRTDAQPDDPSATAAWKNQVWEALFVIGEDENASEELEEFRGERVLGYYLSGANKLVIVTDDGGEVDSVTLVHEIVHALQDMHLGLEETGQGARTEDAQRARNGLVEGDATHVEEQFELYCGSIWNCVATNVTNPRSAKIPDVNLGVRRIIGQPYVDGPGYVDRLRQDGGWAAVNDTYRDLPDSTEQIIHPEKVDEEPVPIEYDEEPTNGWQRFNDSDLRFEGVNGTTLGEAAIYTMFWYQSVEYGIPIVDVDSHFVPEGGAFDRLNYTSAPSEGWGNDLVVPYRKGEEGAYVWVTTWDTERDAEQFHEAYVRMLRGHDATRDQPRVWVVPDGPFEDAFHVVRRGKTVTITNAPAVSDLDDVRPSIEIEGSAENATNSSATNPSASVSSFVHSSG